MKPAARAALAAWPLFILLIFPADRAGAQEQGGPPPALVTVSEVREGTITPTAEFVGTVFYREVSDVSSEVPGKALEVRVDEGDRVRRGDVLVRLDAELLEKGIEATRAAHGQTLADLEKAERDLRRMETLYREDSISEQLYDENRFRAMALAKKAESEKAELSRLSVERSKKTVRAPFGGVVLERHVDNGEWVSPGSPVATLARDDVVEAVVEVPGVIVPYVSPGMTVDVRAGGHRMSGKVSAIVPRGDINTRTFPVKVEIANRHSLVEGMEARVTVPSGKKVKSLIVPRDALATTAGETVVYTVDGGKAKMIPVEVIRYEGKTAGVAGQGLKPGMPVVVKGNERLRDGQPVKLAEGKGESASPDGKGR